MNKNIIKYENSFFSKIKKFFSNLFWNTKKIDIQKDTKEQNTEQINDFKKSIEIQLEPDDLAIQNLQKQYKAGNIKEEDMSNDEHKKLIELYRKQNETLKNELHERKIKLRKKIENINAV